MPRSLRFACGAVLVVACSLSLRANSSGDADLQFQLGTILFNETRYWDAMEAFDRAIQTDDSALALRARKGKVRAALRVAEFTTARAEGEKLKADAPRDPEALTLYADALWSAGLFDEADAETRAAIAIDPESGRARFGLARSLATHSRLPEALDEALAASAVAPRDAEIYAGIGDIYERMNRFDEAVQAYTNYVNLLPNKDRSEQAAWMRSQIVFLKSFDGLTPVDVDPQAEAALHTVPFKLRRDKIVVQARVNGGKLRDFVVDTGSEATVVSRETAEREHVHPVTYTLSAGVGEVGLRGLQLARLDSLQIGDLTVRNLPVLVKNPALRGIPRREGDGFSPLSLGMSMAVDYQKRTLTIGRSLPEGTPDFRLPMRVHRLALVRGVLNATQPAYFVVDTGGEVISISKDTASTLMPGVGRKIPLRVYGTSGWDRDAFLMPGMDLEFDKIAYHNYPLVVLNLRAPSTLLGFQLGGIVGHKFLAKYRVAIDVARSELRLEKF